MTDYKKYINALEKCAKEHENDRTFTGHIIVSDLCRDTANLLEALEQEPKTGHWILTMPRGNEEWCYKCSRCGFYKYKKIINLSKLNYCPNCGCRMVEEQESEE